MKRVLGLTVGMAVLVGAALDSKAWFDYGVVYCDANTNGIIDAGDVPVSGVLVVTTNISGTFSNASWTTATGEFLIDIPAGQDTYTDYIHPDTLPAGTTQVLAPFNVFMANSTQEVYTNNFLIENPACVTTPPPPPPPPHTNNTQCWMTGGGSTKDGKCKGHTFAGVVNPSCKENNPSGGNWLDIWYAGKLQLKAVQIEVVNCGNVPNYPTGSCSPVTPYNFIEFQGVAKLCGIAGNKTNYGLVYFYARAEDLGEPGGGIDGYYLRAYDADGNTLLLVSANPDHPEDVAPVRISNGNIQMHVSGCKDPVTGEILKDCKSKPKDKKENKDNKGQNDCKDKNGGKDQNGGNGQNDGKDKNGGKGQSDNNCQDNSKGQKDSGNSGKTDQKDSKGQQDKKDNNGKKDSQKSGQGKKK